MAYTNTWTETNPLDADGIKWGAQEIRKLRVDMRERLGWEVQVINTTPVTIDLTNGLFLCNATSASLTVNLLTAAGIAGKRIRFIKTDSTTNTVTIDPASTETANGASTLILSVQYQVVEIVSDGTNWEIASPFTGIVTKYTAPQVSIPFALTHNTAWDASLHQHVTANVNGSSFTIADPTTPISTCFYAVYVTYTTTHSIAWGTNFKGISAITPTATAGANDVFYFRYNGTYMECTGYSLNVGA